jgi:hypothetical protein
MSFGRIVTRCAALAFSLTLAGAALAGGAEEPVTDLCPPSHGSAGSGYRDMAVRLPPEAGSSARTSGVAMAGGYRDSIARFSRAERSGPLASPQKIVGSGYRDSLARFPGTLPHEAPRHAMARCGRLDAF